MTLMLALRGGAGIDAQHSTTQGTPEDDTLKEESQAQKRTGSDSTYTNCPKQPDPYRQKMDSWFSRVWNAKKDTGDPKPAPRPNPLSSAHHPRND